MVSPLFGDLPHSTEAADRAGKLDHAGSPRVARPDRGTMAWEFVDINQLIAADHAVRLVALFVQGLDLRALYDAIKARTHGPACQLGQRPRRSAANQQTAGKPSATPAFIPRQGITT